MNCVVKKVSYKTEDKRIDSTLCKRTININRYSELIGGYRIMYEKHIANGDVDFDGAIKLEPHGKNKIITTGKNISIILIWFIVFVVKIEVQQQMIFLNLIGI